jgi:hypothetical protein
MKIKRATLQLKKSRRVLNNSCIWIRKRPKMEKKRKKLPANTLLMNINE